MCNVQAHLVTGLQLQGMQASCELRDLGLQLPARRNSLLNQRTAADEHSEEHRLFEWLCQSWREPWTVQEGELGVGSLMGINGSELISMLIRQARPSADRQIFEGPSLQIFHHIADIT